MTHSKIVFSFLVLTLSISLTSCKKYLDQKPNNSLVVPTKLSDLQALLDDANTMNQNVTTAYGEASTDDYFLLEQTYGSLPSPATALQDVYKLSPTVYNHANGWSKGYNAVFNANYCLEMLDKIPKTSVNEFAWNNIKGSALFFRSFSFLNLLWDHGKAYDEITSESDLGIVMRLVSDFNVPSVRGSVKDCYDRIINDTKEAVTYLPDNPTHPFRPSKAAAYGLLARAYLSMRKYDEALNYSNLCLQIRNDLIDCKAQPDGIHWAGTGATAPFKQFNKETIFYSEMTSSFPGGMLSTNRAKIDTGLYQSYTSTDLRKAAYFLLVTSPTPTTMGYYRFKGSYTGNVVYFTGIATDEMYLTRAECYARKGDKTSAVNDLNVLLVNRHTNAFIPFNPPDAASALVIILAERRKELLFRGLRWMDIKRLNKEGANIVVTRIISGQTYTLQSNANYYALPLPTDIINLTGMPQNPYP